MSEAPAPKPWLPQEELDRILRAQDWGALRKRLFGLAYFWTRSRPVAEELADQVIVDCCDPRAKPWNPIEEPDLAAHAVRVMGNLLSAERKKREVRKDPVNVATVRELAPRPGTPEQEFDAAENRARDERVLAASRKELSDEFDRRLLDLWVDGIDKPAAQAVRLECRIEDIRRARERIKYAIRSAVDKDKAPRWKNEAAHPKKS